MNDAAGTTVADEYGISNLLWSETNVTTAPIYDSSASAFGGGRRVSSSGTGASSAGQKTSLRGDWTFEWTGLISSLAAESSLLIHSNGAGETSADNHLVAISILTTGALRQNTEHGAGTNDTTDTPAGIITATHIANGITCIAVREWTIDTGVTWISFYVDGEHVYSTTKTKADGGGSGTWRANQSIAGVASAGTAPYEIRMLARAMSDDFIRSSAARAFRTWNPDTLYRDGNYTTFVRVLVENGDTGGYPIGMVDLDNITESSLSNFLAHGYRFLGGVDIEENIDSPGKSASFSCRREVYDWSLSPGMDSTSPVMLGAGERILDIARRVRIQTAVVPADTDRDEVEEWAWVTQFDGFISSVDFGDDDIKVQCRDLVAALQWTFCRPLAANSYQEAVYGDDTTGVALETVLQQIIDDHEPASGIRGGKPTLYTPTSPSWNLRRRSLGFVPLHDALIEKSDQIGFSLRYRWDTERLEFRFTLYEVNRDAPSSSRTFSVDEYTALRSCSVNEENIRNVCEVIYTDRTGSSGTLSEKPRSRYVSTDAASIAKYGERYCQISEDAASQIDTATEAQALADAAVKDLAEPRATLEMVAPYLEFAELADYYTVGVDGLHFDTAQGLAVTSIKHQIDSNGVAQTIIGLRGNPAGAVDRHLSKIAAPGIAPYAPFLPSDSVASVSITPLERGADVQFAFPVGRVADAFDIAEVHMTTATGAWTPDSSTLKAVTRTNRAIVSDLDPTQTHQTKVILRDKKRNKSTATAASAFDPKPAQYNVGVWQTRRQQSVQFFDDGSGGGGVACAPTFEHIIDNATNFVPEGTLGMGGYPRGRYTTSAVANTNGGFRVLGMQISDHLLMFSAVIKTGSNITSARYWLGLFEGNPMGASAMSGVSGNGIGFWYDDTGGTGTGTWNWGYRNAGTSTSGSFGSNVAVSTVYRFSCGFVDAATLFFQLDDVKIQRGTADLPSSSAAFFYLAKVRTLVAATKFFDIGRVAVSTQY